MEFDRMVSSSMSTLMMIVVRSICLMLGVQHRVKIRARYSGLF